MDQAYTYFGKVAEYGSIRRASDELRISPSSISRQIAKLEYIFGAPLMMRNAQGVRLTEAGEVLQRFLQSRARDLERVKASIQALSSLQAGHVSLFRVEGMIGGLLPRALSRFSERWPGITYNVTVAGTRDVVQAVADDRCDIGLAFQPPPHRDVEILASITQPLLAVMPPDHPLAARQSLRMADLVGVAVALPDASFGIRQLVDQTCAREDVQLNMRLETNSIDMLRKFAVTRMGIVFLPAFSFEREREAGALVGRPVGPRPLTLSRTRICKRAGLELSPAARRLVDMMIELSMAYADRACRKVFGVNANLGCLGDDDGNGDRRHDPEQPRREAQTARQG